MPIVSDREHAEPVEVLVQALADRCLTRRTASLGDVETGIDVLHGRDSISDHTNTVGRSVRVAGHVERDQCRAVVLRDGAAGTVVIRRDHVLHLASRVDSRDDAGDRFLERGVVGRFTVGRLDEDKLAGAIRETGVLNDPLGLEGVPRADLGVLEHGRANCRADDGRRDNEGEPTEDGGLAMPRRPASKRAREVAMRSSASWLGYGVRPHGVPPTAWVRT